MQYVTELNNFIINVYSHGILQCLKRKGRSLGSFLLLNLFCPNCLFLGIRCTYFFLCLSNGKAPLIKIIIVKVLLMLTFFTNVIKFLHNFVQTLVELP